jgi:hypothetical protein
MRILSKSHALVLALLAASCSSMLPWHDEPVESEVNLAFTLERNLVQLSTVTIDGRPGRFILGSATARTVLDPAFANPQRHHLVQLAAKETLALPASAALPLGGVADAIIGADAWHGRALSIDYHSGLVTYQKEGIQPAMMTLFRFPAEPMIEVSVNGRIMNAIVDTSNPDTLVLPSPRHERGNAHVTIAGSDFGTIDVQYANVMHPRVGNRLLSYFLVTIDYGQRLVGLWRDPRVPLWPAAAKPL